MLIAVLCCNSEEYNTYVVLADSFLRHLSAQPGCPHQVHEELKLSRALGTPFQGDCTNEAQLPMKYAVLLHKPNQQSKIIMLKTHQQIQSTHLSY